MYEVLDAQINQHCLADLYVHDLLAQSSGESLCSLNIYVGPALVLYVLTPMLLYGVQVWFQPLEYVLRPPTSLLTRKPAQERVAAVYKLNFSE